MKIEDRNGFTLHMPESGGKAGPGRNITSSVQCRDEEGVKRQFRFKVDNSASYDLALSKARDWCDQARGMQQPPRGIPFDLPARNIKYNETVLNELAQHKRCQQALRVDRGQHFIFCGGYYHGKATKTAKGYRCEFHK